MRLHWWLACVSTQHMLVSSCPIFFGTQNSNRCQLLPWFKIQIVFNEPNYNKTPRLCAVLYCSKLVVSTKKSLPLFMGETNWPFVSETNGGTPFLSSSFLFVWLLYVVEFVSFFLFFKKKWNNAMYFELPVFDARGIDDTCHRTVV